MTYDDDDTANKAISEYNGKFYFIKFFFYYCVNLLDQHIDSIGAVVRVQLAQRRPRNNDNNDRGGRGGTYYFFVTYFLMMFCVKRLSWWTK